MSNLDGLSVKRNPVAYALAALAVVAPDLYELAVLGVDRALELVDLGDDLEAVLARIIVALLGFALGALGVQRVTISTAKVGGEDV